MFSLPFENIEKITIKLGYSLLELFTYEKGKENLKRISRFRKEKKETEGVEIPKIIIRDILF